MEGDDSGAQIGLAEAQIAAIEAAFASRDQTLARLRRELDALRDVIALGEDRGDAGLEHRLRAIETRLERQDQALRHVLERLIGFFEDATETRG